MAATTHQTARLSTGKHGSPAEGTCIMELASMLADEPFTDTPQSVCPVIRDFLRSYNDRIDDLRRQDLYASAAAAVGSRSSASVERERLRLCADAARTVQWRWPSLAIFPVFPVRRHAAMRAGWALAIDHDSGHSRALALFNDLLDVGHDAPGGDQLASGPHAESPLAAVKAEPYQADRQVARVP